MILLLVAFLAGVLTILSPCILPVLPFVFARADQPFLSNGLPLLIGMALMFAVVATLASVGGGWAVAANQYGRFVALVLLALFGLTLCLPGAGGAADAPPGRLGDRLSARADAGCRWARALRHRHLLVARRCDRAAVGTLCRPGARLDTHWRRAPGRQRRHDRAAAGLCRRRRHLARTRAAGRWARVRGHEALPGCGEWVAARHWASAVLAAVVAIALGADTGVLSRLSLARTASIEQGLLDQLARRGPAVAMNAAMMRRPAMTAAATGAMQSTCRSKGCCLPLMAPWPG